MKLIPNSKEWWEEEFKQNWKVGIDGRKQTAYFMRLLIQYILPLNFYGSVLDFGCAMGQGVNELKRHYPNLNLLGYDFASRATFEAKITYPELNFTDKLPEDKFDFVVSSNVLEHFQDPTPLLEQLCDLSEEYVIIMTPYDQETNEVHECRITENTFPTKCKGFKKIKTIIAPSHDTILCSTDQIIFIYRRCEDAEN